MFQDAALARNTQVFYLLQVRTSYQQLTVRECAHHKERHVLFSGL